MLARNTPLLNWRWSSLTYMGMDNVLSLMTTIMSSIDKGVPKSVIKRILFESAEGAYSQHMFAIPDVTVLIAGRMYSDKSIRPVVWTVGAVLHMQCKSQILCSCLPSRTGASLFVHLFRLWGRTRCCLGASANMSSHASTALRRKKIATTAYLWSSWSTHESRGLRYL